MNEEYLDKLNDVLNSVVASQQNFSNAIGILGSRSDTSTSSYSQAKAEADKKENDALDNLSAIANFNQNALKNKFNQGNRMYDISDDQARRLADAQTLQNKQNSGSDWFEQFKKLQRSANQLVNASGNYLSGSNLYNLWDLLGSENDTIRNTTLEQQRENQNTINNDLFETTAQNINARNENAIDTEYGLNNILADYAAQATTVAPDKAKERGLFGDNTVNPTDFLNPNGFFDSNIKGPADITKQGWYTEDDAAKKAKSTRGESGGNTSSAANSQYWKDLIKGYNYRY